MTLQNPSFEDEHWLTLPGGNQSPSGWELSWALPGEPLQAPWAGNGDTRQVAECEPECVHKLSHLLPEDEQLGGEDALIRAGDAVYKVFGNSSFRVVLKQQVDVPAGTKCNIIVPVNVHGHYNPDTGELYNVDTGAGYWRVITNGYPHPWNTFNRDFEDRTWLEDGYSFTALYGIAEVAIEFECHTPGGLDFFCDNVQFTSDAPQPVECRGNPREQYARVYNLLPQTATEEQFIYVARAVYPELQTIGFSADDAGIGDLNYRHINVWWFSPFDWYKEDIDAFYEDYYPGVEVEHVIAYDEGGDPTPEPPPIDPPPGFTPINYVPTGCKLNFHGVGDDGQTDIQTHIMARGASMATAKAVQDIGWLSIIKAQDRRTQTVGRFIDNGKGGPSLEGFDSTRDPIAQAQARMIALAPLCEPHRNYVDFWEIINEQDPEGATGHVKLCEFLIEAMHIAEFGNYKLALFSYSMGVPEPHEWDAIAETGIFERAAQGGHAISLHEYGVWPTDQVSLLCRYRYVYEKHILPRGLNIPLFITEYAPDAWTLSAFTDAQLMEQLRVYDAELAKDPYVAGGHVFTVGGFGSWPQFRNRWVQLYGLYEDYVVSVRNRAND